MTGKCARIRLTRRRTDIVCTTSLVAVIGIVNHKPDVGIEPEWSSVTVNVACPGAIRDVGTICTVRLGSGLLTLKVVCPV